MNSRIFGLIYGGISYLIFFLTFNYAILFIGNIFIPVGLDSLPTDGSILFAIVINISLITLFGIQHSVMARPRFKRWLTRYIPQHLERSTYVLVSTIFFFPLIFCWQPMGGVIWSVQEPMVVGLIYAIFATGWGILFLASFQLNHFDLFGLRHVWLYFRGREYTHLPFQTPWLYRYMRHPLYVGLLIGLWAAPTMTVTHFALALACTLYVRVGAHYEEQDLKQHLPEYTRYREEVSAFVPGVLSNKYLKSDSKIQTQES